MTTSNSYCMHLIVHCSKHNANLILANQIKINTLFCERVYLTNRFHVAVRLFSNRSQMTSKCGKNKKVAHEAIAECVTDVLTTF